MLLIARFTETIKGAPGTIFSGHPFFTRKEATATYGISKWRLKVCAFCDEERNLRNIRAPERTGKAYAIGCASGFVNAENLPSSRYIT